MIYQNLLKPLLFSLDPETAHHVGLAGLKLMAALPRPAADPFLRTQVAGLTFDSPVGLAAGFDKNAEAVTGIAALGFGFLEVGTVTPRPQPGNPKPRIFRVPSAQALINRLGFNNHGAAAMKSRLERLLSPSPLGGEGRGEGRFGLPIGVNIGKNKDTPNEKAVDDYLSCLETLHPVADFFIVNVSSPNTPGLRGLQAPDELGPLLQAVAQKRDALCPGRPLFVKISPDESFGEAAAELAMKHGFAGLVATNTTRSREGLPAGVPADGGMSGKPLFAASTDWVRRIYKSTKGKLPIIGVGGIFSARDAYEKILAGASLVEIYTGFIYEGPSLPGRIHRGLAALLRADGFASVADAVGRRAA